MVMFNIVADLRDDFDEMSEESIDDALDTFALYHPALGRGSGGRAQLTLSLPAESNRQAMSLTFALLADSGYLDDFAQVRVLTSDDFDRESGLAADSEMLSVSEAARLLGVSRQRILQRIGERTLPAERVGSAWALRRADVERLAQ